MTGLVELAGRRDKAVTKLADGGFGV